MSPKFSTSNNCLSVDPSNAVKDPSPGPFSISYFDKTDASGYYVKENLVFSGTTVTSVVLAVATDTPDESYGVMGIGLDEGEVATTKYPGFINTLRNRGVIGKRAYSIFLNSLGESDTTRTLLSMFTDPRADIGIQPPPLAR